MQDNQPKIRVIVRKRPLNRKQLQRGEKDIVLVRDGHTVAVREEKLKVDLTKYTEEYPFTFDGAYDQDTSNIELYQSAVKPLIDSAFHGAKVTCFAYGQTGSGKTHTMLGNQQGVPGLYLLASQDIFKKLVHGDRLFSVWVSFYEIYCGKLYDLLNDRALLFARQDAKQNVNIVGLQQKKVPSVQALMQTIEFGGSVRITAQNSANSDSSRSHAVLQILLKEGNKTQGRISFIDLAGSERGADHADQSKQTRFDGAQINKSLLALKQCIRALDHHKNHTPFRGSKLTMVLKDSFTGYCRSLMIANISPGSASCQNTLNTLKYADRVKELKKPRDNSSYDDDPLGLELMLPRGGNRGQMKLVMEEQPQDEMDPNENKNGWNHRTDQHSVERPKKGISLPSQPYNQLFPQKKPNNFMPMPSQPPPHPIPQPIVHHNQHSHTPNHPNRQMSHQIPHHQSPIVHQPPSPHKISKLTARHEELIKQIVLSQQQLLEQHQHHITQTVQIVKAEGQLMADMDRVNSDIHHYLKNLEDLLQKKMNSLMNLQKKVSSLQKDIHESQQIEKTVRQVIGQEESLLPNDEDFSNRRLF